MSKERVPGPPALYLKKVDSAGHPSSARRASFERPQASAIFRNVRIAGPDIWRRTLGSLRLSGGTVEREKGSRRADSISGVYAPDREKYGNLPRSDSLGDAGGAGGIKLGKNARRRTG